MKVFLRTFGCRANQYDSETVRAMIERSGGEVVERPDQADVAIFNSCAVTADAEAELRKSVRRVARDAPGVVSVVMGCAAARDDGTLRTLPSVSHVVPGGDVADVARALALPASALGPARQQHATRALLRIQDGCDEHCTFCATTLARGVNRARPIESLVEEAERLAERHSEIVLTGIHIGTYGADTGTSLGELVERLVRDVPTARFRLSSVEATEVDQRLSEPAHLVPHLHAPLQSGSDRVLRRMGRHWYTARDYALAVERIARDLPVFGLGADVIAGFPGESDTDHRATIDMIEALPFTYLHVFPFSRRPGTAAERLPGHLHGAVVQTRARTARAR
ncbi:MAG: MiaB/RimO family radical SAM methylthiotransferase [Gemmatimonadota bacterium]